MTNNLIWPIAYVKSFTYLCSGIDKDTLITHLLTLFRCGVEISADNTHLIIKNLAIV